jgi:hypothetical protein
MFELKPEVLSSNISTMKRKYLFTFHGFSGIGGSSISASTSLLWTQVS